MNYSIENEKFRITIQSKGGNLCSIFDKITERELQWKGDEKYWKFQDVVIFPLMGKPENGYDCNGKTYNFEMAHGVARNEEFALVSKDENTLIVELNANAHTLSMFPFNFKLQLKYELIGRGYKLTYIVSNNDGVEMPFHVGSHVGINLTEGVNSISFDKEIDVRYFPYRGGLCQDTSDLFAKTKKIELTKELYDKVQSLVLERMDSEFITLERTDGLKIKYGLGDCEVVTVWALSNGGRFACVEPWWGLCDTDSASKDIFKKPLINIVKNDEKRFSYSLSVEE